MFKVVTKARTMITMAVALCISLSVIFTSPRTRRDHAALLGGVDEWEGDDHQRKLAVLPEVEDLGGADGQGHSGDAAETISEGLGAGKRKPIDLTMYVVFHNKLHDHPYSDLKVPLIPAGTLQGNDREQLWRPNKGLSDGNEVIFLSTNPSINKTYNHANPLFQGRIFREWMLKGYDSTIGPRMNEYGAMWSVFNSNWSSPNQELATVEKGAVQGKEEWIGFLQYDMKIDSHLVQRLRRGISKNAFVRVTPKKAFRRSTTKPAAAGSTSPIKQCCAFGGVLYPSQYLLHNALGFLLLQRYNSYFRTTYRLKDVPTESFLDMFIVPVRDFNRFMPWLGKLMQDLVEKKVRFPDPSVPISALGNSTTPASGGGGAGGSVTIQPSPGTPRKWRRAKSLDVLESALALALSFELRHVQIPMRHFKSEEEDTDSLDD